MLHKLGVNMGHLHSKEEWLASGNTRKYMPYECQALEHRMNDLTSNGKHTVTMASVFYMFKGYVIERLLAGGEQGMKNSHLLMLSQMEGNALETLPLSVISVKRKLEDVFNSDFNYNRDSKEIKPWERAANLGQMVVHQKLFEERIEPVCFTTFEECKDRTYDVIDKICTSLQLSPEKEQYNAAYDFVDQKNGGKLAA